MDKAQISTVTMPAGTYYVGDPCYNVPDARWMEWLEAADYMNAGEVLLAELDGHPVLGVSTMYGDGSYFDQEGNEYGVDAGLIGLVPEAIAKRDDSLSTRVTFTAPFECGREGGVIVLGHVRIDTDPKYDDEGEEW